MSTIPRLVISAPSSGHGKTAVSVGLLSALSARGYRAAGFKIGPDHVDAAYLGLAAGRPGRNLDPRMIGAKRMGPLFAHGAASLDIAVVEGTMGLFDGLAGRTDSESTAQISGLLRAPVVLVVDVGAMGQSVAALVHGFRAYDELLWLGGVILNRVASSRHEQLLREALDDIGVPVLGALRRHALTDIGDAGAPLPSRHHGVAPVVHHNLDAVRAVRRLGEVIAGAVDIDRTMALARSAPRLTSDPWSAAEEVAAAARTSEPAVARIGRRPIIGVAFSYPETAELLAAAGAEVVPFDPLRDEFLPDGVDGLVVGGALPESYAEELGFNTRLRTAVAAHAAAGKPIAAEGTGLVWLCRDFNGRPMCGVVDASARETDLVVLGYREATARSSSVLLPVGTQVVGHKMHRTTISPRAGLQAAWTWAGGPAEGFVHRGVHASYLGLHWAGTPSIAARFVAAAGATATPVQGQWTTPSTHPYNRPSVVPASQAPSGSGTTLQFPAAAAPAGAPANLSKTTTPAASPVSVPGPVSAPGGFVASTPTPYSPPAPVAGPGAVSPVSAPATYASSTYAPPAPVPTPAGPRPPAGPQPGGGRPIAPTRPLDGAGSAAGFPAAAPSFIEPAAAPVTGDPAPAWPSSAVEGPTAVLQTGTTAAAAAPAQTSDDPAAAGEDDIASSPFGPTSRAAVALASASRPSGRPSQAEESASQAEEPASHAPEPDNQAAEQASHASEPGNQAAELGNQASEPGAQVAEPGGQAPAQDGHAGGAAGATGQVSGAGTAGTPGVGPSSAAVGASVGVPSTPNAPAPASGLPSSGVVPTTVSASPATAQSPTSPAAPPPTATAAGPGTGGASGPVSGAGAAGSQPVASGGVQPVSTPPLSAHQWPSAQATSSAVPVSSAPMPTVVAPVSAAPAGMTVIAAAGSDLVAADEAPTAYLQLPAQGGAPLGAGDHSPVSAPPAPAAQAAPRATHEARETHEAHEEHEEGQGDGPPTSGPPAGGATEAA